MSYILVEISDDGMIRAEDDITVSGANYDNGCGATVIHKTSVDLDKLEGVRVFNRLDAVKSVWSGPESDEAILSLTEEGQGESIWMAEEQSQTLGERLKIWSSCYGGWKVKKLNA